MLTFILLCVIFIGSSFALERSDSFRLSLDGKWSVTNANNSITQEAIVPGGIYTDLQASGVLSDNLFYRFNDVEYRWVSNDNWTYSVDFDVSDDILKRREVLLVFYGLDTVADISLNDELIGSVDNMFVRYEYSVKDLLKSAGNHLEVRFTSPIFAANERYNKQAEDYIIPPQCVDKVQNGECHVNFLRKTQASFSWDWGPAFPSMGIWKSVEIVAFDTAIVRDVVIQYDIKESSLNFDVYLEVGSGDGEISGVLEVVFNNDTTISLQKSLEISLSPDTFEHVESVTLAIPGTAFEIWYPNGYGNQNLYPLEIMFRSEDESEKSSILFKYGFRALELVQTPVSQDDESLGLTFYFNVNGHDVFAKGANWIPGHVLPELSADERRIRPLLQAAKDVGMNMLRVWGGGIYESDLFYDIADELGIMIWQDFTFACAMYPANDDFLSSVSTEVRQQVRRLNYHPSLSAWSGNNENEGALRDDWYGIKNNFDMYKADYVKLYADTIMKIVNETDSSHPFVISSPSNGLETIIEGYVAENPSSSLYGDRHYYDYSMSGWDPNKYPYTRFASEYGFQSLASFQSIKSVSEEEDWDLQSDFSVHRQHHPSGNEQMMSEIKLNLPFSETGSAEDDYKAFIYFSQINQAMAVRTETEFYRRSSSGINSKGEGRTMGALYWQLNDVWQCPSWSSIDFNGRWKMLHYFARDFFAPVIISPYVTSDGVLNIGTVSDATDVVLAYITLNIYRYDSFEPLSSSTVSYRINGGFSQIAYYSSLDTYLTTYTGGNATKENSFLYIQSVDDSKTYFAPDSFLPFTSLASVTNLVSGNPTVVNVTLSDSSSENAQKFIVNLETANIALFVWLEVEDIDGVFSQNGFVMVSPNKAVTFETTSDVSSDDILQKLSVTSLNKYI